MCPAAAQVGRGSGCDDLRSLCGDVAAANFRNAGLSAMRRRSLALGSALVASLGGCALGPDFVPPAPPAVVGYLPPFGPSSPDIVPGQHLIAGADIPGRWWEAFRSPHLNDLIACGIERNPSLQAAEAAVRMAQAGAAAQEGALFPLVGANFNPTRLETPSKTLITNAANGDNIYSLHTGQLTVAYVADVFGGVRRQVETAQAQAELQSFQREGVYITLTSNIALAAIQEASLRAQIAATRRIVALQSRLLDILNKQNERGQIAQPDVVTQETAVAQAKLLLPPLERQLAQQRNLIAVLTGRFPATTWIPRSIFKPSTCRAIAVEPAGQSRAPAPGHPRGRGSRPCRQRPGRGRHRQPLPADNLDRQCRQHRAGVLPALLAWNGGLADGR